MPITRNQALALENNRLQLDDNTIPSPRNDLAEEQGEQNSVLQNTVHTLSSTGSEMAAANVMDDSVSEMEKELFALLTKEEKIKWLNDKEQRKFNLKMEELRMRERIAVAEQAQARSTPSIASSVSELDEIEKFSRKVKACIPKMPTEDMGTIPGWFNAVENVYELCGVPREWWGRLLIPFLCEEAKVIFTRLSVAEMSSYPVLKAAILEHCKMDPAAYLNRFIEARKNGHETWTQFATRLGDLLRYYWESKQVTNLEKAIEVTVADQFKRTLLPDAREYVTLNEAGTVKSAVELAKLVQKFEEAHIQGKPKITGSRPPERMGEIRSIGKRTAAPRNTVENLTLGSSKKNVVCYNCGKPGHLKRECRLSTPGNTRMNAGKGSVKVNHVEVANHEVQEQNEGEREHTNMLVAKVSADLQPINDNGRNIGKPAERKSILVGKKRAIAIVDSGAELTVIQADLIKDDAVEFEGKVCLKAAFGQEIVAEIVTVPMSLAENAAEQAKIMCAATKELRGDIQCLLNPHDFHTLEALSSKSDEVPKEIVNKGNDPTLGKEGENRSSSEVDGEPIKHATVVVEDGWLVAQLTADHDTQECSDLSECEKFKEEQRCDPTLTKLWQQARAGLNGMKVEDGLLYREDEISGQKVKQLVVPKGRREKILKMAHDSPWAGHLKGKKTRQRIRSNFYWPGVKAEVLRYCQSCHNCQIRAKRRADDRVPISPIRRPENAFEIINMDVVGPIDPPSARGHKYVLCLVDYCTRWPEVICLKSLTTQAAADALLSLFARVGVPKEIRSDQGTNFTSKVMQALMQMLNIKMHFSPPDHSNANGLVERWNSTFREMIAQVISENGRQWDRFVPFVTWAYREVPNETTGVAPFELVYGRIPYGPLAWLADEWAGKCKPVMVKGEAGEKYLAEIQARITAARERAKSVADKQQAKYTERYNLRARSKRFEKGDQVLIAIKNPNNKLDQRWEGPAVVGDKKGTDSYIVHMEDGRTRWIHADKLRKYYCRVNAIGVTFSDDKEFGKVVWAPRLLKVAKDPQIDEKGLMHIAPDKRLEIKKLISKYGSVFTERPGRTSVACHKIRLKEGFEPCRSRPYRIPVAIRPQVDAQIEDMLESGIIEPIESEFSYPMVCAIKRDGSIRICVDYRQLNSGTIPDAFPMSTATDLIFKIANSFYITVLDMSRGFWQVPLEESSKKYVAFITDKGLFTWNVMPFGLRNSPATYQRMMNRVLAPHSKYAVAYIDDVAVFSSDWEDHLQHLENVLKSLQESGLTANPSKCSFAKGHTSYLGRIIGSGSHTIDEERVAPIREASRPKSKKELRSFLGFCSYYRDYIENFAAKALPLTNLTSKNITEPLPWNEDAEKAFQSLKIQLCEIPTLRAPVMTKPFIIFTDASNTAVGAVLAQNDDNGKEVPITFASKKLNETQRNWSTIEREAYAVVWALGKFDTWIFGSQVRIVTDHNPLAYLTLAAPRGGKLTRWALALQRYDIVVTHRKGKEHQNADWLSRC